MSHQKTPSEITELLNSSEPDLRAQGYELFLGRTHWREGSTPDDLKKLACRLLFLDPEMVEASSPLFLSPERLWASQTKLEKEKVEMVEAAHRYLSGVGGHLPPIVVWDFFENRQIRYVVHDGHHRCYFCHQVHSMIRAIVLEPLGNYREAESRLNLAFQIKARVFQLPIEPAKAVPFI